MGFFHLPFILDGATGTNLYEAGMPDGVCVEKWVLDNPGYLKNLQKRYAECGSGAVMACTFGANRISLARHGYGGRVREFNAELVRISKEAVGGRALVAGDMSPTGLFIEPYGDSTFEELLGVFREQASALRGAGADYIAIETMMNLTEARAALLAAKETGLPVTVTVTVGENGKTLSGGDVFANLTTLSSMGADAVGLNCSTGPRVVLEALRGLSGKIPVPLIAKPNAGLPENGVYKNTPEDFAEYASRFLREGIAILGGCCGTTPEHIRRLAQKAAETGFMPAAGRGIPAFAATERETFEIGPGGVSLSREIACGDGLGEDVEEAEEDGCGAVLVRIENEEEAQSFGCCPFSGLPPAILAADEKTLEKALMLYQGRALVSRLSAVEGGFLERMAEKYGAVVLPA